MTALLGLPARVHQSTLTIGTGTYNLRAAPAYLRNFGDYYSSGRRVPYCATDSAGNFEIGSGVLTIGSPDTIARTVILRSSNGNNAVDWGSSTAKDIFAWQLDGTKLSPEEFGAKGDGSDDSAAINAWFAELMASGLEGRLNGWYTCTSQLTFDLTSVRTTGVKITGAGMEKSGLILSTTSSPALKIWSSSGDCFFSTFRDFGVTADLNGIALQVGDEAYGTATNSFILDGLYVKNAHTTGSPCAVEMNWVLDSDCYMITNNGGKVGDSLRLRQTQFSCFRGSYSTGNNGVHFADGFIFGNNFQAVDIENTNYAVANSSGDTGTNIFTGGTMVFDTALFNSSAVNGYRVTVFDGCNYGPNMMGATFFASGSKYNALMRGVELVTTPSVPATATQQKNDSGNAVLVNVWDSSGSANITRGDVINSDTSVNVKVFDALATTGSMATVILQPGDSLKVTYSGSAFSWIWRALL
jgi:hypothetical protein